MNASVLLTSAALLIAWNPIALPNVAPPPKKNQRVVAPVKIERGEIGGEGRSVQARIIIPRSLVHGGDAAGAPAAAPRAGSAPPPPARDQASIPAGTIIAGLAMSLAAASLVFVVRSGRAGKMAAVAVLVGAVVLGIFGAAQADLIPGRPVGPPRQDIVIELADEGDSVILQVVR